MEASASEVRIPSKAVSEGTDLRQPARGLLEDLNLLGTAEEDEAAGGKGAIFTGPPQSVALIEAGATAATKLGATSVGTAVVATWAAVANWWPSQEENIQIAVLAGAALVTAALAVALGYLLASDVRGRAAAAVATIDSRARVATTFIEAAERIHDPAPAEHAPQIVPLPKAIRVKYVTRPAADEDGWLAVALERQDDGGLEYILVKGSSEAKAPVAELDFAGGVA